MMSPMKIETLKNIAKAMSEEEKELVLAYFPTKMIKNEIARREVSITRKVDEVSMIVRESLNKDSTLENKEKCIKVLKNVLA